MSGNRDVCAGWLHARASNGLHATLSSNHLMPCALVFASVPVLATYRRHPGGLLKSTHPGLFGGVVEGFEATRVRPLSHAPR